MIEAQMMEDDKRDDKINGPDSDADERAADEHNEEPDDSAPPNGQGPAAAGATNTTTNSKLDDAIEIDRLARIKDRLARDRETKAAAKKLSVRVGLLRAEVHAKRAELFPPGPPPPPTSEERALLDAFNRDHSVLLIGGKTRVLRFENVPIEARGKPTVYRVPSYLEFTDVRNFYLNKKTVDANGNPFAADRHDEPISIGDWWLSHPNRETYAGVIFEPRGPKVIDGRLNLWTDFAINPLEGDWSLMDAHIAEVLSACDAAIYKYTLDWLAFCFQHANKRAEAALVFIGEEGTGKGLLSALATRGPGKLIVGGQAIAVRPSGIAPVAFGCPICDADRYKLYYKDGLWGCRACHKLDRASRHMHRSVRGYWRALQIRRRIAPGSALFGPLPVKPLYATRFWRDAIELRRLEAGLAGIVESNATVLEKRHERRPRRRSL